METSKTSATVPPASIGVPSPAEKAGTPGGLRASRHTSQAGVYACAVLAVALAALVRITFPSAITERAPFVPFLLATILTAWLGGTRPALMVVALSAIIGASLFRGHGASVGFPDAGGIVAVSAFVVVSGATVAISNAQRRAKARVEAARERTTAILESMSDAFVSIDREWRLTYVNAAAERMIDKSRAVLIGRDMRTVNPESTDILRDFARAMEEQKPSHTERYLASRDSWLEIDAIPMADSLLIFFRDVSARRKADEERARHVQEVEGLNSRLQRAMGEAHHRIKNSLQVITALINVQTLQHKDVVPVGELERLTQHIGGLAAIHDILTSQTKTEPLADSISVNAALEKLVPTMQSMIDGRQISLNADDAELPVRLGTALTILVNELLSNAVKHGSGDIQVTFTNVEGVGRLEVADDGPGLPDDFDPDRSANTGLELVRTLAAWDLAGSVGYGNRPEGGARIVVEFPCPNPDAAGAIPQEAAVSGI